VTQRLRGLVLARALYGGALLAVPRVALRIVAGAGQEDRRAVAVARLLGARHVLQAGVSAAWPTPAVLAAGGGADRAHAASGLGLALLDRRRARPALVDASLAASWSVLGQGAADR